MLGNSELFHSNVDWETLIEGKGARARLFAGCNSLQHLLVVLQVATMEFLEQGFVVLSLTIVSVVIRVGVRFMIAIVSVVEVVQKVARLSFYRFLQFFIEHELVPV
jgi:hypothetical protein